MARGNSVPCQVNIRYAHMYPMHTCWSFDTVPHHFEFGSGSTCLPSPLHSDRGPPLSIPIPIKTSSRSGPTSWKTAKQRHDTRLM